MRHLREPGTAIISGVLILITLFSLPAGRLCADEKKGTITVKNETSKTIYVVIDDYNQGEVWPNYSETYHVTIGEHKVEAHCGGKVTTKYLKCLETYPDAEWYVTKNDF